MSLEFSIIGLRFVQYAGAMILCGSSFFLLYGKLIPESTPVLNLAWSRRLIAFAAAVLLLATPLQFLVQTANLTGSWTAVFGGDTLSVALFQMNYGKGSVARVILALAAFGSALYFPPGRRSWGITSLLGALICASFAWMGHGAATEGVAGWLHLVGDILHSVSAAAWIGALAVFVITARAPHSFPELGRSLEAFSGFGTLIVALIVSSGLVNSAFLVGWDIGHALGTPYGQLLFVKLLLFGGMLGFAAANRFYHTPSFRRASGASERPLSALKTSLTAETVIAFLVLGIVAWLGTLAPVTAQ